ncbi:hypothetical protein [Geobacillus sp. E263]|uniref:hypothetical protein n=1 Tax=Geobacillus sp. E263 TaxID=391290 RepID=UPI00197ABD38|nr:hypothetical protein [Geobacillus sp. E263]
MEQCLESYPNVHPIYKMVQDYREGIRQADYHRFLRWLRHQLLDSKQPFFIHMLAACAAICRP